MEYYSDIKKEILSFAGKCIDLEDIILSKIRQISCFPSQVETKQTTKPAISP
jgi:hypothetical protein